MPCSQSSIALFCPRGVGRTGGSRLMGIFLLLLVWLSGLFMGSYLQMLQWTQIISTTSFNDKNAFTFVGESNRSSLLLRADEYYIDSNGTPFQPLLDDKSSCPFPDLDPFDPKIIKYVRKYPTLNCLGGTPSIVDVVGDEMKIDPAKVLQKLKIKAVDSCVYRSIKMSPANDYGVTYGLWSPKFTSSIRLATTDEHVVVKCHLKTKVVAKSYIALVKKKNEMEKKRIEAYNKHAKESSPQETLSILLVGVDGISKQNFARSLPRTRDYLLNNLKAIEFHKYNKIGLNTFPNIIGLLAGLNERQMLQNWTYKTPFDKIDHRFIWDQYQQAGYRTSIMLDMVRITAFHYLKRGWSKPKFDFYPRPITIASEPDKLYRRKSVNCMGDTPEVTLLHDYWVQLTSAYNNTPSTPYFAFSFMARQTHDDQNKASAGDELYLNFFQELAKRKVLNNTLIIFFSDHGERFGSIRYTYNGLIEAKTPFLFFVFPPWFEKKYPEIMVNFRRNTHRLMTAFDIHATMKDLLHFTGEPRIVSPLYRSISLFSQIPSNRTCNVAGIPIKYCACTSISRDNVTSPKLINLLVKEFLEYIVSLTNKFRKICKVLQFKKVLFILSVTTEIPLTDKNMSLYHITIQTAPGDAVYEATLSHKSDNDDVKVTGDVSRLNMYRGQAECINDIKLRPFCFCSQKT